ncbi:9583_t:CDS:2 [Dentiscutata erythropus]|uniref:9583_t:CDS:1 n=1 Tax=Dentiscutata erythropus TaxID=1348616 RepID=A0A9N8ZUD4_9GLOM|nr:9583_t:CDS:2 [Dentiscutata erythropus]
MSSKLKTTLSNAQKREFCLYAYENKMTRTKYIDWIEQKLTSEIINPDKKRNRSVTVPELELALKEFVLTYQHKTVLSDLMLIEKAKLLVSRLGVPDSTLNFSSGWLHKFKERNGIGREKLHDEVGSVDNDAIIRELLLLRNKCTNYPFEQIYNMDETALFYQLEPDHSLATQRLSGRKKDKECITIALYANANGSHKLKPLIIRRWMLKQVKDGKHAQDLKMDILQGIRYVIQDEVMPQTIQNCWHHTRILPIDELDELDEPLLDELLTETPLLEELSRNLRDLNFSDAMHIEEYLAIPDENIVYEVPNKDQIIINLVEIFKRTDDENNENQEAADSSIEKEIISPNAALKSLENIHTYLLQQEGASEHIKLVGTIEKFIKIKKKDLMKQSTIDQYFNQERLPMNDNKDFYYDDDLDLSK